MSMRGYSLIAAISGVMVLVSFSGLAEEAARPLTKDELPAVVAVPAAAPMVDAAPVAIVPDPDPASVPPVAAVAVAPKPAAEKAVIDQPVSKVKHKKQKTDQTSVDADGPDPLDFAADKGDVLSLRDALRETYFHNPSLRAARAEVKAVFEKMPQAMAGWLPSATASGSVTYSDVHPDPGADVSNTEKKASLSVAQPLYRGGRTVAGTRAAQALIDAQLATLATSERAVLFTAAQSYMDVLRAKAVVNVNERNRSVIARQLKATKDRFNAGDLTRTDVAQSEFRLARAEADLTAAVGSLRSARAVFEQVVGIAPEKLALPAGSFKFPSVIDEAVAMAEIYNPDVIAAQARHVAAKENVDVEFGSLLPDVSATAAATSTHDPAGLSALDKTNTGSVGVTLSVPLYEGGATRSRVRAAKYTANELYMRVIETKRAAHEEAVRAWEDLNAARAELTSREAQVRAAEIARAGVRNEAEQGERTILDALDADLEVRDAQVALITAKRNQVVAEYALASALGMLVPGNLGIKDKAFDPDSFGRMTFGKILSTHADVEEETGK